MPTTSTSSLTPAPTPVKYDGPLQAIALPMPAGAVREELRMGAADGSLDLDAVVAEFDGNATIRSLLTTLEFERGVFLAWTNAQGTLVYVQIYQFRYPRQAAQWSAGDASSLQSIAESSAALDEIEGGRLFVSRTPAGKGAAHATYVKDDLAVMISTFRSGAADVDLLKRLAVEQYKRLP